jgi:hypothetical protein
VKAAAQFRRLRPVLADFAEEAMFSARAGCVGIETPVHIVRIRATATRLSVPR